MTVDRTPSSPLFTNIETTVTAEKESKIIYEKKILWRQLMIFLYINVAAFYGAYLAITKAKWQTLVFSSVLFVMGKIGMSAGAHRLWSHRAYKANVLLRTTLAIFFVISFEGSIYSWARDHRVHHKYQDTNADPYNANRGFWFSHVGWLMLNKHPEVTIKGRRLDFSDLDGDKIVMFQLKYMWILAALLCIIAPTFIQWYFWAELFTVSWYVTFVLRVCLSQHCTWTINSLAHMYGNRPYEISIRARENDVVYWATLGGEGWHNYHHAFPWDYRASEIYGHSLLTGFINLMAKLGWASDLKITSSNHVQKRALRTGDGSYKDVWGWGDNDISIDDKKGTVILKD